jgi:hypothetical protein
MKDMKEMKDMKQEEPPVDLTAAGGGPGGCHDERENKSGLDAQRSCFSLIVTPAPGEAGQSDRRAVPS